MNLSLKFFAAMWCAQNNNYTEKKPGNKSKKMYTLVEFLQAASNVESLWSVPALI